MGQILRIYITTSNIQFLLRIGAGTFNRIPALDNVLGGGELLRLLAELNLDLPRLDLRNQRDVNI